MTDVTYNVLAGADDGHARKDAGTWWSTATNYEQLGHNPLINSYHNFFRFDNVTIPAGVSITAAVIRFTASHTTSATTCNVNVSFEDADDPSAPTSANDLQNRPRTTEISWSSIGSWTAGNTYDTDDLSTALQEVVDRVGWASGQAITCHIRDNGSSSGAHRGAASYENSSYTEAQLVVSYELGVSAPVEDGFGISDTVDSFNLTDALSDDFSINDQVDAQLMAGPVIDLFGISDTVDAGYEHLRDTTDSFSISDAVEGFLETPRDFADVVGLADSVDAFHYSDWLRANRARSRQRFFFTLTGATDNTTDIEMPVSAIYARKRSGDPTYLQVTIPTFNYSVEVALRPSGEMVVDVGFEVSGSISLREEILRADLEDISTYEGPVNRSIVLTGHRTIQYGNQLISFDRATLIYRGYQQRARVFRFPYIDPYLNAGDTVVVGDESFTCNNIVYIINALRTTMELREAL